MNVLVSCDYQDGSAAGAGKSLAMCFGAMGVADIWTKISNN